MISRKPSWRSFTNKHIPGCEQLHRSKLLTHVEKPSKVPVCCSSVIDFPGPSEGCRQMKRASIGWLV